MPLDAVYARVFLRALQGSGASAATVKNRFGLIRALLGVARDMDAIDENPAEGIRLEVAPTDAKTARLPFTTEHLQTVLSGLPENGYQRWIPLVGLYTGMRVEEIAQLSPDDIREEQYTDSAGHARTVAVLYVTDEGEGQGIKTEGSRRRIPMHSALVKAGFLDYVRAQQKDGGTRLFPGLRPDKHGREAIVFSRWFQKYLRATCKITDARRSFHSLRHNFKDALREAGTPEDVSDALTGHSNGSVGRNYGSQYYPLRPLAGAVESVAYHGLAGQ